MRDAPRKQSLLPLGVACMGFGWKEREIVYYSLPPLLLPHRKYIREMIVGEGGFHDTRMEKWAQKLTVTLHTVTFYLQTKKVKYNQHVQNSYNEQSYEVSPFLRWEWLFFFFLSSRIPLLCLIWVFLLLLLFSDVPSSPPRWGRRSKGFFKVKVRIGRGRGGGVA